MNILLIDNGSALITELETLLSKQGIVTKRGFSESGVPQIYDAVILSGSSNFSVEHDREKFLSEIDLIKLARQPIIGICFGSELIAHAFGAQLEQMSEKKMGVISISVIGDDSLFGGRKIFSSYESHRWRVKDTPEVLLPLAYSEHGIEAFRHRTLPVYGLQFHPEHLTDESFGDEILRNILLNVGSDSSSPVLI